MLCRKSIGAITVVAASMVAGGAQSAENARYPDWKGAWERFVPEVSVASPSGLRTSGGQPSFDQTKPWGPGQEAPLTPEYQKVLEDSLADQAMGGQGNNFDRAARCLPNGMPLMMTAFLPLEFVVTPDTTYILTVDYMYFRRIFTDGRDWPSIGPFASLNATHCANAHRFQRRMIQLASIVFSHATLESDETRRVNKNMKLLMDGLIYTPPPSSSIQRPIE